MNTIVDELVKLALVELEEKTRLKGRIGGLEDMAIQIYGKVEPQGGTSYQSELEGEARRVTTYAEMAGRLDKGTTRKPKVTETKGQAAEPRNEVVVTIAVNMLKK